MGLEFVALAFGFCASLTSHGAQDLVALGYVSKDECVIRMIVGDSHGQAVTVNDHEIGVTILQDGAEVRIDDLRFVIPKTEGA